MCLPSPSLASTSTSADGIYLHTRSDGERYSLSRLKAKTKSRGVLIIDMLFADAAAFIAHKEEHLQNLIDCFSQACEDFRLTINLKKTNLLSQDTEIPPTITLNNYELDVVKEFTYLGSAVTDNLSMDSEISRRIVRATSTLARLSKRVWDNDKLTLNIKVTAYRACALSEPWTLYSRHDRRLNTFHMLNLRRTLGLKWPDRITDHEVLRRAATPGTCTLLRQRRLRWLGHVPRMQDARIPRDLLHGELATGKRAKGRPQL